MANRYRLYRPPLAELPNTANTSPAQRQENGKARALPASPNTVLPHNVSLEADGSLVPRNLASSPDYRRRSKLASPTEPDSKRNSAISTTSTTTSIQKRKTYIGHWQLGKTIGKGGCSRVRAVRHRYTQQYGAVKIIARSTAESTLAQSLANLIELTKNLPNPTPGFKPMPYGLEREIALMKLLEHKNIVKLFDVWENRNELYLIMEYFEGGELFHHVEQRRGLTEFETVVIYRQIISALLYCHRMHICHRDLKPENILLNMETLEVKLIDFGMAALQPQGGTLSTPCGSPHYAAPEVVSSRPYNGKCADAWSCGVILYVMLTGTTPFNYSPEGDIRVLFTDIAHARYNMPQKLSVEAKDLIKRIFVPDPTYRITMDAIWDHPLMHKYDKELGFDGPEGSKEVAIGPLAQLEDWTVNRAQDIDRQILRNMRTLWHHESEAGLINKLLNKEINQEKMFYAALVKHQEESLESYIGEYESMAYSASDYHHSKPAPITPVVPLDKDARSQSQYSIMNDEHLRPSHSFVEPPQSSMSSYDPYRSSRDPVTGRNDYVSVVVHRDGSNSTQQPSARASGRQNRSLRADMSKYNKRGIYVSNSSLARSRSSLYRSSNSRNSLSTTNWPSSPPVLAMRPSDLFKRNVSFTHLRKTSSSNALLSPTSARSTTVTPKQQETPHMYRGRRRSRMLDMADGSPDMASEQIIQSKKAQIVQTPRIRARKTSDTPSQTFRSEIRKHSMELEKACEEAFFRSSIGSGGSSTPSTGHVTAETPPTSVSMGESETPELNTAKLVPRPLPDTPGDTPGTFLTRTLKEFRAKLAAYHPPGDTDDAKFGEVMKMIDDLVPAQQKTARRLTSAPESRVTDHIGNGLPMISEESQSDAQSGRYRSFTAPVTDRRNEQTIRMVPSSPGGISPLNIRKRHRDLEGGDKGSNRLGLESHDRLGRQRSYDTADMLQAIDENDVLPSATPAIRRKKSGWFGLAKKFVAATQSAPQTEAVRANRASVIEAENNALTHDVSVSGTSSEFPIRKQGAKRGLGKWLGRRGAAKDVAEDETVDLTAYNHSMDSLFSTSSPSPSVNRPVAVEKGRSWFARFLNVKPAQKLLCFSIPRGRARQELIILLREWQNHGIRDLQYSRETQSITARVDRQNSLDIKPVSFRVELFVVLEHGRRVGLSIARFTQVKGAASGFRKVLEVVDGVMRSRAWLVEDEEKWKALCEIVEHQ